MLGVAAIYLVAGALLMVAWYLFLLRQNRKRARELVRRIEAALEGEGKVLAVRWLAPSLFRAALQLRTSVFQHPAVVVRLTPREMPFAWLVSWWRKRLDTLTFEADLEQAPSFDLAVQNYRWLARTRKRLVPDADEWTFLRATPCILASRKRWQREVSSMMTALVSCRERQFLTLSFQRHSPHFSATVPLHSISAAAGESGKVFAVLRELASSASTSRR